MRKTSGIMLIMLTLSSLTGCGFNGNDYVYGYYPIKDETIDGQTQAAHKGVQEKLAGDNTVEWQPLKRSLNGQNTDDEWFREEGTLTIDCTGSMNGIPCDTPVNYVLDWNVDNGNITGFMADGISIVDNEHAPIDNKLDD